VAEPNRAGPTSARPYTLLSCGISLDGYLDDASDRRLLLSNDADFDRVDGVRAGSDAILVGAATVRHDDPRLQVRCAARVRERRERGLAAQPVKVTVTNRAKLDPGARFFTVGTGPKLVYCASDTVDMATGELGDRCVVIDAGRPVELAAVLADLHRRGVRRLLVEGGGEVLTQLLTQGLADELHLVVAPVFVGDTEATRFVGPGPFPFSGPNRARLVGTRQIGDVVLLRYALSERFCEATWG
jgi:5-amino-6-(5-phosphoribosylamino)uracil reductase